MRVAEARFQQATNKEVIFAVIVTPYSFSPKRVAAIEDRLPTPKTARLELHIRSIIMKETMRTGYQHELPAPAATESDEDKSGQQFLFRTHNKLNNQMGRSMGREGLSSDYAVTMDERGRRNTREGGRSGGSGACLCR